MIKVIVNQFILLAATNKMVKRYKILQGEMISQTVFSMYTLFGKNRKHACYKIFVREPHSRHVLHNYQEQIEIKSNMNETFQSSNLTCGRYYRFFVCTKQIIQQTERKEKYTFFIDISIIAGLQTMKIAII